MMMLSGCGAQSPAPAGLREVVDEIFVEPTYNEAEKPTDEDDSWKYEVAERLYNEFCYFYDHKDDNIFTDNYYNRYRNFILSPYHKFYSYNLAMAADRANGILTYKDYLSDEKYEHVMKKSKELYEEFGNGGMVYFGYSKSGLHYISLSYNGTNVTTYARPLCDKLRKDDDESEFLYEMCIDGNLLIHDFYVEDLRNKKDVIDVDIRFSTVDGYKKGVINKQYHISPEANAVLGKYNRSLVERGVTKLKNKSWNLYATRPYLSDRMDIFDVISNGEITTLDNAFPLIK